MSDEIISKIDDMGLNELSDIAKLTLSRIYNKLREEGFGCDLHCSVVSFGPETYDVNLIVIDNTYGHSAGVNWPITYMI